MKIHVFVCLVGLGLLLSIAQAKPREQRKFSTGNSRAHEMTNRLSRADHTGRHHDRQVVHHAEQGAEGDQQRRTKWVKRTEAGDFEPQQDVLLREEHFLQVTPRNPSAGVLSSEGRGIDRSSRPKTRRSATADEETKDMKPSDHRGSIIKGKVSSAAKRSSQQDNKDKKMQKKANRKAGGTQRKRKSKEHKNKNSKVMVKSERKAKNANKKKDGSKKKGNKHMWKKAARKALKNQRAKEKGKPESVVSDKMAEKVEE